MTGRPAFALLLIVIALALPLPSVAAETVADVAEPPTLAVLNFANRNPGDGWDWLGKGLADMLITDLSATDKLRLVTREDMQSLFDEMRLGSSGAVTADSAQQFGKVLQAEFVLTGSFAQQEGALTIEGHVVEITSQKVWRVEAVVGRAADALKLEKNLALDVVKNFNLPLSDAERALLMRMPTQSIDAGKCFYGGMDAHDRGESYDAIAAVRQALGKDPKFDRARFELGRVYRAVLEFAHADAEFAHLVALQPQSPFAAGALLARAKLKEKFFPATTDDVISAYDEVAARYPQSDIALLSRFHAGILAYQADKLDKAAELLGSLDSVAAQRYSPAWNWARSYGAACLKSIEKERSVPKPPEQPGKVSDEVNPRVTLEPKAGPQQVHLAKYSISKSNRQVTIILDAPPGFAIRSARMFGPQREGGWRLEACDPTGRTLWRESAEAVQKAPVTFERPLAALVLKLVTGTRLFPLTGTVELIPTSHQDSAPVDVAHALMLKRQLPRVFVLDAPERFRAPGLKDSVALPPMEGGAYYPSMAQDYEGRYWLVWNDQCDSKLSGVSGGDADLWLANSADGKSWSQPVRLPVNSDGHDVQPCLIVGQDRLLRLVWTSMRRGYQRFEILTSVSRDGKMWSFPRVCAVKHFFHSWDKNDTVEKHGWVWGVYGPRLAQTRDGGFWMTYQSFVGDPGSVQGDSGVPAIGSSEDGFSWTTVAEVRGHGVSGPVSLVQGLDQTLQVGAIWDGELSLTSSRNGDMSWPERRAGIAGNTSWPNLTMDRDGVFYLAYAVTNRGMAVSVSRDAQTWGSARFVGPAGGNTGAPFLFHDRENNHWFVWASGSSIAINQSVHVMKVSLPTP